MGIVLDVILIVIILLNVIICYKKGLVKLALIYVLNMAEVHKNQNNFDIFSRFY